MNAKQLRNSILQQAIQGRLVPQDPNDEPASVLLERIRKEKEQLVKEGKLKKKDLVVTPIADDERPFDLPSGWEWCRLGTLIYLLSGQDLTPDRYTSEEGGIPYITGASCFIKGKLLLNRWTTSPTSVSHYGDLLITCKGTVGTMAYNQIGDIHIARQIMAISSKYMYLPYIQYFLEYMVPNLEKQAHSIIPGISRDVLLNLPIPLPPLAEQRRIVAKIEELMPLVERYGKAQTELDNLNSSLPSRLRQSVLQEAISGKLVSQTESEEASAIYCKANGIEIIDTDEIEVPQNWAVCTLGQLVSMVSGTSYGKGDVRKEGLRILRGGNIQKDKLVLYPEDIFIPLSFKSEKKNIRKGDIIIVGSTGSKKVIGKPALITKDYPDTQIGAFLRIIRPKYPELIPYIWTIFQSPLYRERISTLAKGTNINNIKEEYITDMLIPLPPLAEQKRIVAKIEELFAKIDKL